MDRRLADLLKLLELERLEINCSAARAATSAHRRYSGARYSARHWSLLRRLSKARIVHSLHAYFLRPGDFDAPIVYEVDRSRDGQSFSNRRVIAIQHGQQIFNMAASFQVAAAGRRASDADAQGAAARRPEGHGYASARDDSAVPGEAAAPVRASAAVRIPAGAHAGLFQAREASSRSSTSGFARSIVRRTTRRCSAACWRMSRTITCSTPLRCLTPCPGWVAATCGSQASIMPCGFMPTCRWRTGCSTRSTVRAPPVRGAFAAAASFRATASSSRARTGRTHPRAVGA